MLLQLVRFILQPSLRPGKRQATGLKKQVTLRLGVEGIDLYLRECAHARKKPILSSGS